MSEGGNRKKETGVPVAVEAERGVLGEIVDDCARRMPVAMDGLKAEAFFVPQHRLIWECAVALYQSRGSFDMVMLYEAMAAEEMLQAEGGREAADLAGMVIGKSGPYFDQHIKILNEKHLRRVLLKVGGKIATMATEATEEVAEIFNAAEGLLFEAHGMEAQGLRALSESMAAVVEQIERVYKGRGKVTGGLESGFVDVDRTLNGFSPGQLIVIAGRPAMGKTAIAMNIAEHLAVKKETAGAVFSLEMSEELLTTRMVLSRAKVNLLKMRDGMFGKGELARIDEQVGKLKAAPLYLDATPGLTIYEIRARARLAAMRWGIKFVVVDYLQKVRGTSKQAQSSREREVAEVSDGLKNLAMELGVPVIVPCQLGRKAEERRGNKPQLSDLRESGSIEQDADVVALLYRKHYYSKEDEDFGKAELEIAKNRNGPVGTIDLRWDGETTRFGNRDGEDQKLYG